MSDEWLNAVAAARYLQVSRQRIYELVAAGRLGQRVGGYWLFRRNELDAYRTQRHYTKGGRPKRAAVKPDGIPAALRRQIDDYVAAVLRYGIVQRSPGGGFVGESLDFPGISVQAPTKEACAIALRAELDRTVIEYLETGTPLPVVEGVDTPTLI